MTNAMHAGERIVVGVDGSEASQDALRWAARQADLTGASLQAVLVWRIPTPYGAPFTMPTTFDYRGHARRALDDAIRNALGAQPSVAVSSAIVEGHPAPQLLKAAVDADLLVVGSRGHGAFTGMLVGSVSGYCVANARCPVVVVRPSSKPA